MSAGATHLATNFGSELSDEAAAKVTEHANSQQMAMFLKMVIAVMQTNRYALEEMYREHPQGFEAFEAGIKAYRAHARTLHELADWAHGRLLTAKAYADTQDGAAQANE